jgi:hypothetical protein
MQLQSQRHAALMLAERQILPQQNQLQVMNLPSMLQI